MHSLCPIRDYTMVQPEQNYFYAHPGKKLENVSLLDGLFLKERICYQRGQILPFKNNPYFGSNKFSPIRSVPMIRRQTFFVLHYENMPIQID